MYNLFRRSLKKKEPWQIAAARFCVEQGENDFNQKDLVNFLESKGYKVYNYHVESFFYSEVKHPAGVQHDRGHRTDPEGMQYWTAPLQLVSSITDYDELKHARESSRSALRMAILAVIISGIAAVFQALQYFDISNRAS